MPAAPPLSNDRLTGFDAEFRDLDHYIRVITDRIWEQRRLEDILRYYSDPCQVETPSSVSTRIEEVIEGTRATLTMFPDRRLLAEDIIWSGDAAGGYLSSHRIVSPMTHLGAGVFGPPTGRKLQVRTIADCVCRDNRIIHEWLVRDVGAIAVQTGTTPEVLARRWLAERGGWNKPVAGAPPPGYVPEISGEPVAQRYAQALRTFSAGRFDAAGLYDEAVHHIGPCATTRFGHVEVGQYWTALWAAFKAEDFCIEHLASMPADGRPARAAVRWRAHARHAGDGAYGPATGKRIEILGINHVEFVNGLVLREWVLVDDVALWMQVLA
ncbi:MAG: ester cyclase [Betaproteobacteria bacterium]|nr:ester cyclase [Betaproteobacteria bacterium]